MPFEPTCNSSTPVIDRRPSALSPAAQLFEAQIRAQRQELEEKHRSAESTLREQGMVDLKEAKRRSREARAVIQGRGMNR